MEHALLENEKVAPEPVTVLDPKRQKGQLVMGKERKTFTLYES